jgi:hypothetical protein
MSRFWGYSKRPKNWEKLLEESTELNKSIEKSDISKQEKSETVSIEKSGISKQETRNIDKSMDPERRPKIDHERRPNIDPER